MCCDTGIGLCDQRNGSCGYVVCSSAKRENFKLVAHFNTHYVVRSIRTAATPLSILYSLLTLNIKLVTHFNTVVRSIRIEHSNSLSISEYKVTHTKLALCALEHRYEMFSSIFGTTSSSCASSETTISR